MTCIWYRSVLIDTTINLLFAPSYPSWYVTVLNYHECWHKVYLGSSITRIPLIQNEGEYVLTQSCCYSYRYMYAYYILYGLTLILLAPVQISFMVMRLTMHYIIYTYVLVLHVLVHSCLLYVIWTFIDVTNSYCCVTQILACMWYALLYTILTCIYTYYMLYGLTWILINSAQFSFMVMRLTMHYIIYTYVLVLHVLVHSCLLYVIWTFIDVTNSYCCVTQILACMWYALILTLLWTNMLVSYKNKVTCLIIYYINMHLYLLYAVWTYMDTYKLCSN